MSPVSKIAHLFVLGSLLGLGILFLGIVPVQAENDLGPGTTQPASLPGLEFLRLPSNYEIGDVLVAVYRFFLSIVGIAALVMFVIGAVIYMTSGDSQGRTTEGASYMKNAIWGLVLAMTSWIILVTIDPTLVQKLDLRLIRLERATRSFTLPDVDYERQQIETPEQVEQRRGGTEAIRRGEAGGYLGNTQINVNTMTPGEIAERRRIFAEQCRINANRSGSTVWRVRETGAGRPGVYDLICTTR